MRKASKILYIIGGIFGILLILVWLGLSIAAFAFGGFAYAMGQGAQASDLPASIVEALNRFLAEHPEIANMNELAYYLFGVAAFFLVMFIFAIPCVVISFILIRKEKTGLPLPIVAAVLSWSGNIFSFVASVLAIVNWAVVERKEDQEPKEA